MIPQQVWHIRVFINMIEWSSDFTSNKHFKISTSTPVFLIISLYLKLLDFFFYLKEFIYGITQHQMFLFPHKSFRSNAFHFFILPMHSWCTHNIYLACPLYTIRTLLPMILRLSCHKTDFNNVSVYRASAYRFTTFG